MWERMKMNEMLINEEFFLFHWKIECAKSLTKSRDMRESLFEML